jgi:hypothetical protein
MNEIFYIGAVSPAYIKYFYRSEFFFNLAGQYFLSDISSSEPIHPDSIFNTVQRIFKNRAGFTSIRFL